MKTKIVYVVVASKDSIYLEQAYVSVWSLKHYNPYAHVTFVMDDRTKEYWDACQYEELKSMVNDVIVYRFGDNSTNHYRSRWLKTSLRSLVKGDYLFLDTDTVIADNISEIDNFEIENIGAVIDTHQNKQDSPLMKWVSKSLHKIYGLDIAQNINYYNSGAMFVRDSIISHKFYKNWHKKWLFSISKGFKFDQLSLYATDIELNGIIQKIKDIYNYQVSETVRFLFKAKILHFFNGKDRIKQLNPFFGEVIYRDIKSSNKIDAACVKQIIECKSLFNLDSKIIGNDDIKIYNSHLFRLIQTISKNKWLFNFLNSTSRYLNYINRKCFN